MPKVTIGDRTFRSDNLFGRACRPEALTLALWTLALWDVRFCRVCGCTDDSACVDPLGGTCFWGEREPVQ